jgi:hypothetical protein
MKTTLFLLLAVSCSHWQRPPTSDSSHEAPSWVYSPYDACVETHELCATGESKTRAEADAQAKVNLASIFEVQIKSDLSIGTSSTQTFPWQAQVKQEVQQSIQESVSQVLETVQIKKHFKKDGLNYSLASLDRTKASDLIGERLTRLDKEIELLWSRRQRTNLRKLMRLSLERERLNERFSIVSGQGKLARVSFSDLLAWKDSRPVAENLSLKVGQAPDWMTEKVKELLTEAGFRVVRGEANKVLSLHVDSIKEFLNVDGFEKYTFTLQLTNIEKGEKKKVISVSETVTGRSQADALLKVKSYFNEYLEQHLSDLHLD